MNRPKPADRLEAALATLGRGSLEKLARELRDGGMPRAELYALFDAARGRHASDPDESAYDEILEVMDLISGWCHPSRAIDPDPPGARDDPSEGR